MPAERIPPSIGAILKPGGGGACPSGKTMAAMTAPPPPPAAEEESLADFNELFGAGASAKRGMPARASKPTSGTAAAATAVAADYPVLELKHFGEPLRLSFGEVTMRTTSTKTFIIVNESSRAQRLDVRGIEARRAQGLPDFH